MYRRIPKYTLDLVPLPKIPGYSIAAKHMTLKIQAISLEFKGKLEESNAKYKEFVNKHRKLKIFKGDLVMVHFAKGMIFFRNSQQTVKEDRSL